MARNRNRKPGPIRRTIVEPPVERSVSRNLLLRVQTVTAPSMPVRRTTAVSLSGAQTNGWQASPHLHPCSVPMTSAWSRTKSQ